MTAAGEDAGNTALVLLRVNQICNSLVSKTHRAMEHGRRSW